MTRTRVVRLLQLKGIKDAERKPHTLQLHLLAVEPVRLNLLVHVVVVRHHGACRNYGSSRGGRRRRRRSCDVCWRRLKKNTEVMRRFKCSKGRPTPSRTYRGERGPWRGEHLRWGAERGRSLLGCVRWGQDLWSWNVRTGSAAGRRVAVRVVMLRLHLSRRRGHRCRGRSLSSQRTLVNSTAKR